MWIAPTRCRRSLVLALLLVGAVASVAQAQASSVGVGEGVEETGWHISGEVGGIFGGQWLSGASAPRVSTDAGLALSVSGLRRTSGRAHPGISLRGNMQPITMQEAGAHWSGGTATDVQALGTVTIAMRTTGDIVADAELGGGVSLLTGTREVFPFSEVSRFAPVAEGALVLAFGGDRESLHRYKPFALVIRYGVLRVDANGGSANLPNSMTTGAGWVGRTTIALRLRQ